MLSAYVNPKKAFNSVIREALRDLQIRGIRVKIIGFLHCLCFKSELCGASEKGDNPDLIPLLFNTCNDWVLDKFLDQSQSTASAPCSVT